MVKLIKHLTQIKSIQA